MVTYMVYDSNTEDCAWSLLEEDLFMGVSDNQ